MDDDCVASTISRIVEQLVERAALDLDRGAGRGLPTRSTHRYDSATSLEATGVGVKKARTGRVAWIHQDRHRASLRDDLPRARATPSQEAARWHW